MNKAVNLLRGVGLGAAAMYMADPAMGRRRRSMVRNKAVHAWRKTGDALDTVSRDIGNRTQGVIAETKCLFTGGEVDDDVLRERVRARIGRYVSHPGAIEVHVNQGLVSLSGPVLEREVGDLLSSVSSVRGVQQVENRLQIHEHPGDVPALQGPGKRPGERLPFMQENWSPTTRVLMGAAGGALAVYGYTRRNLSCLFAGTVGAGMLARAVTNKEIKRIVGRSILA
ncbi:MAG: BON domain-containing protein [Acidobacteriota bacterium]